MIRTRQYAENVKGEIGEIFSVKGQDWVIGYVNDWSDKPEMQEYFNKRGVKASLGVQRPNGKVIYSAVLRLSGHVAASSIISIGR